MCISFYTGLVQGNFPPTMYPQKSFQTIESDHEPQFYIFVGTGTSSLPNVAE